MKQKDVNLVTADRNKIAQILDALKRKGFIVDFWYSSMILTSHIPKIMVTIHGEDNAVFVHSQNGIDRKNDITYNLDKDPLLTEILLG